MNAVSLPAWERPTLEIDDEASLTSVGPELGSQLSSPHSALARALAHAAGAPLDRVQLAMLYRRIPLFEAACRRAGLDSKNPRLQAAFFDLSHQCAPRVWNRFLNRLPQTLGRCAPSMRDVVHARFDAMFDARGRFTAAEVTSPARAIGDQLHRQNALETVLAQHA
jgi:hypothetical protein